MENHIHIPEVTIVNTTFMNKEMHRFRINNDISVDIRIESNIISMNIQQPTDIGKCRQNEGVSIQFVNGFTNL